MKLYNDYASYLKKRYGTKVYRIGLDAGFSCPNRDGSKGRGGCTYCTDDGSRSSYADPKEPVEAQLSKRIAYLKDKYGASKFIAYFQAFTNTHAPLNELKKIYDKILPFDEIVGLSIGTRPDAVDREKLALIASYNDRYEVWVEYGLQSAHDRTLAAINRGHNFDDFVRAVKLTKEFGLTICTHIILGLPGETRSEMLKTAKAVADLGIDGVKIHLLHILKGSALEASYRSGKIRLLEQDEYVDLVCDFLEYLPENMVIQRLTGEGPRENHVAPIWALDKIGTINKIGETLERRRASQGVRCGCRL